MEIRVYNDRVDISGYVNAVERISKKIRERGDTFYEKIKEGAFGDAIRRNSDVKLLFNHKHNRVLASTCDNLTLFEDSIGLFARATVTDSEVVEKAKSNKLVGWSFGFSPLKVDDSYEYDGEKLRSVECLNLYEVSILDDEHIPAYNSMSLDVRDMGVEPLEIRNFNDLSVELSCFDNSFFINKIDSFLNERNK